ncbi:Cell surface glycoprotein 1 [Frankliniella fusca]|uniref:Cell surface glycoprotein 1 n=1 Tax=Frankliniella fusca TaxID=407009 RepID=A0AAE1L7C6_9NEOP|nr:Cell surface glycoprotein 1 [Frankliniella fusca]
MRTPKNLALTVLGLCGPAHLLLAFLAALLVGVRSHGRTFHVHAKLPREADPDPSAPYQPSAHFAPLCPGYLLPIALHDLGLNALDVLSALLRAPARSQRAHLVLPHLGHVTPLTGSLAGDLPVPPAAAGVVHHHHHHVVVLQGGGFPGDAPPSKEAMAALLQLPRTIMGHQHHLPDTAMSRSHTVTVPRVYQSLSTVGGGVTHQYHFHSAQDLAAAAVHGGAEAAQPPPPAPLPPAPAPAPAPAPTIFPQHDPDAEWYARQQAARVLALLGVHVDEMDDDPPGPSPPPPPPLRPAGPLAPAPASTPAPAPTPTPAPTPAQSPSPPPMHPDKDHVSLVIPHVVQDTGAHVGVEVDDEVMKKELVKYLIKVQNKYKELNAHHSDDGDLDDFSGWKSRSDDAAVDGDVVAGGDLDVETA